MLKLSRVQALVFDLDDTILKTERLNIELITRHFREHYNLDLDSEDQEFVFGHDWQAIYTHIIDKYRLDADIYDIQEGFLDRKRRWLQDNQVEVAEGIQEVLSIDLPKVIVSGSGKTEIQMLLENAGLTDRFDATFSIEEYGEGKPAPDGFLRAMEYLELKPKYGLAFEDSGSGILAARTAGLPCVFMSQFAAHNHSDQADMSFNTFRDFYAYWRTL